MKSDLGITSIALSGSTMGFIMGPKLIMMFAGAYLAGFKGKSMEIAHAVYVLQG